MFFSLFCGTCWWCCFFCYHPPWSCVSEYTSPVTCCVPLHPNPFALYTRLPFLAKTYHVCPYVSPLNDHLASCVWSCVFVFLCPCCSYCVCAHVCARVFWCVCGCVLRLFMCLRLPCVPTHEFVPHISCLCVCLVYVCISLKIRVFC